MPRSHRRRAGGLEPRSLRFLAGEEAPPTVNPSLWRQSRLNMHHGLFEVVPGRLPGARARYRQHDADRGRYRGHRRGHADLDRRCARRNGALFQASRLPPVVAVIFTHTHTDHWGGARGVLGRRPCWPAAACRSSRRTCSWNTRCRRTSSPGRRCCGGRNISSARSWQRASAARSIAGLAKPWRRVRSRCCARPT